MRRTSIFLIVLALAACAEPSEPAAVDPTGSDWALESGTIDGAEIPVLDTHPITMVFEEDGAGGTSACNQYSGSYQLSGTELAFSDLIQTEMACVPDEVMDSERMYLEALDRVDGFAATTDSLTLRGDGVELMFSVDGES